MLALSLFSSSSSSAPADDDVSRQDADSTSIISDGAKIEGLLEFTAADLRIEGTVHGDITTDGRVVVSKGAEVQGTIRARTVRLAGYVEGHVRAEEQLVLLPDSEVHATLEADVLEIQPGADFSGKVPDGTEALPEGSDSSPADPGTPDLIPVPSPSRDGTPSREAEAS
jgi:cytoskeletal protein CcmA (bactofilin family)